jgi:hypothetical protein
MSRDNVDTVTSEKEYHNSESGNQLFSTHPNYSDHNNSFLSGLPMRSHCRACLCPPQSPDLTDFFLWGFLTLAFKSLAVSLRTTRFNIQNFYMVLALRKVFFRDLRTNSDLCLYIIN